MAFLIGFKDFAEGLARGFGLFLFERNNFASMTALPHVEKTNR
jgi:hypothetical protein